VTVIDISPVLEPGIAVWPGDEPMRRSVTLAIAQGHNIDLSSLHSTVHVGAHCDAPSHYHGSGKTMEQVGLEPYWGPCFVTKTEVGRNGLIEPRHCQRAVESGMKRALFYTGTFPDPCVFNEDFAAFSPSTIDFLGSHGFLLVGIDTPSVDPFRSKDLPAHQALLRNGIVNIEGIYLDHVAEGKYELAALPLKLKGFDGSPVRAVLKPYTPNFADATAGLG
jgi:arylformamidase